MRHVKREKVLLYNPQAVFYTMPLALVAVGSALDAGRYEVRLVDGRLERDPVATVLDDVDDALCLGVSVLSGAPIRDALRVTRAVKRQRPDLPVVWGGWHPSLLPVETLADPDIDVTVQGQGEVTFGELVDRLAGRETLKGLPGSAFRMRGQPTLGPRRPLASMNDFPAHNYELIPIAAYFERKARRQLDYVSSMGCHFRCAFCADPLVYGRQWVALEASRVVDEVAYLWRRHGFDDLSFQDEAFFTDRERATAIAEAFVRLDLRFTWQATLRPDQGARLPDEVLSLCQRSGLRRVILGVESGSDELLDWMTKDSKVSHTIETAEKCVCHGIAATFAFIVGFPGETDASVRSTLDLIKRLRAMSPKFETPIFYYRPYPGSRISQEVAEEGYGLPQTLEGWAEFDYVGSSGPWVSAEKRRLIERFSFYSRLAWGGDGWRPGPLQVMARWRCKRHDYRVPWEKVLADRMRPTLRLS
jgi:anaerobic magnesium-protoporphyrin IX monomethyl ester cyclase